jgi:phenylacetyl-CoA:acceptor oxidoreductase
MQYAWGANVGLPLINEIGGNVVGNDGIIINRAAAKRLGIAQGDLLLVESASGKTRGRAQLREGIRPDTILIVGQFDQWATPYAKDLDRGSLNSLTPLALSLTDSTGSGADLIRVSVRRAAGGDGAAP